MDMADKFNMPVLAFVDTAGAYPGVEAEARGQAEAIAATIQKCLRIRVPLVSVIIGEGRFRRRHCHCHRQPDSDA